VTGEFDVEHFRPQVNSPELGVTYDNLLYACHTCNLLKGDKDLPDPSQVLTAEAARVNPDGSIEGRSPDARRLIAILGLDSDSYRRWRSVWMRNVELAEAYDQDHFRRMMGFPDDLPRLDQSPPVNTRPEGVQGATVLVREKTAGGATRGVLTKRDVLSHFISCWRYPIRVLLTKSVRAGL